MNPYRFGYYNWPGHTDCNCLRCQHTRQRAENLRHGDSPARQTTAQLKPPRRRGD
jgi:hypothetical protein